MSQSIVFLVLAFVLGVAVGWLLWARDADSRHRTAPVGAPPRAAVTRLARRPGEQPEPQPVGRGVGVVAGSAAPLHLAVLRPIDPQLVLRAPAPASAPAFEPEPEDLNGCVYEYAGDGDVVVESVVVESMVEDATTVLDPVVEPTDVLDLRDLREETPDDLRRDDPRKDDLRKDDLRRIEGIGPKISAALSAAGIVSYRQLAEADAAQIAAALAAAGVRSAPGRATWAEQAKLLAAGDGAGLERMRERRAAARTRG